MIAAGDIVAFTVRRTPKRIGGDGVHFTGSIQLKVQGKAVEPTQDGWLCAVGNCLYVADQVNVIKVTKPNGIIIRT